MAGPGGRMEANMSTGASSPALSTAEFDAVPITRRRMVTVGGATLLATSIGVSGCAPAMQALGVPAFPHADVGPIRGQTVAGVPVGTLNSGTKPIFVAPPGNLDPLVHSVADTLFWGDILMEHAMFFVMLMPGPELAGPRGEAERFQRQFSDHLARLRGGTMRPGDHVAFNNRTLSLANAFIDYKARMEAAQTSGQIRSLVWPMFFAHTRNEAMRFTRRLGQLNQGNAAFDRREVVPFWADKMEEHSLFVAHLLDPSEKVLKRGGGERRQFREARSGARR